MTALNTRTKSTIRFYLSTLLGFFVLYLAFQSQTIPFELKLWIYLLGVLLIIAQPTYQYLIWMGEKSEERLNYSSELPPLMRAAWQGDLPSMEKILSSKVSVNCKDANGATALMYASVANQSQSVSFLLNNGAKKGLKTYKGNTAMFFAVQEKHNEIITLLSN